MSAVTDRMQEMQDEIDKGLTWPQKLLVLTDGDLHQAAIVDLAIDGNFWFTDLRLRPFAGNDELKDAIRAAREASSEVRGLLINLAWIQEVGNG